jgi:hypothetical protein
MEKIEKRVFRNDPGGTGGCAGMTVFAIGAAGAVAYFADAGTGGWACVGIGALLLVILFGFHLSNVFDRSPKLVIDAEGIHDFRQTPPVEYDWDDYTKVFADVSQENCGTEVALEVVRRSGTRSRVTISASGLEAKPPEIVAAIEEVWAQVKARRGDADEDDEPKAEEKPAKKAKPWEKGRAADDGDDDGEKKKRWEW